MKAALPPAIWLAVILYSCWMLDRSCSSDPAPNTTDTVVVTGQGPDDIVSPYDPHADGAQPFLFIDTPHPPERAITTSSADASRHLH